MRTSLGWAPEIPDHWEVVPLNAVAKMGTGHTPDRSKPEYWENCTIPWVTLTDASRHGDSITPMTDTNQHISEQGMQNSAATLHPAGTVFLSRTASVGHSAIMGAPMATTQDFATWQCGARINPRYLLLVLRAMKPEWERLAYGSTHKTIYMPDVESLRVTLPPLETQRAIVQFLDLEVSKLDHMRRLRLGQYDIIDELALSEIDHVMRDVEDIPRARLGRLATVQTGLTLDSSRAKSGLEVETPYLRVANVQDGRLDLAEVATVEIEPRRASLATLRNGDVLMTEGGDLDKLGRGTVWHGEVENCLHQNHIFAVRPNKLLLLPEFLALLTRSASGREYFERTGNRTTNLASTNSSTIRGFPIPLAEIERQRTLIDAIETRLRRVRLIERLIGHQLALLGERRRALIAAAVTGQVEVTTAQGVEV